MLAPYRLHCIDTHLKLMKAKNARTSQMLACFDKLNLRNAFSIPYIKATIVANCKAVASIQVPRAPHCIGGPFFDAREGRLSKYSVPEATTTMDLDGATCRANDER